ncbi:MAG: CPBP family intramembrane glutamic endopeptidase [Bryobacteraceae bacterium]
MRWVTLGFVGLLAALWAAARYFGVTAKLDPFTITSCALLLFPCWAFGFGIDAWLKRAITNRVTRVVTPLSLVAPYLLFAIPRGDFRWDMCLGMAAIVLAVSLALTYADPAQPDWRDWMVLAILGISVDLHFFDRAWPLAGIGGMPKLLFVDAGLYGYLVIRPIGGIGYDFRARWSDLRSGLSEFVLFTPIAIALGFALGFLHFHRTLGNPLWFGAGWIFTFFFIALPEEFFFRGLMLNMLERQIGTRRALVVTSLLFGLAHFNKRTAYFNWRYVILAAIAGVFYGRAWLAQRRLFASSVTHATVDTVWSIWLR